MRTTYRCRGVCSSRIHLTIEDGILREIAFEGGCSGNAQGLSRLAVGMKAEEVARQVRGVRCGSKPTSCPDQLANAIEEALAGKKEEKLLKSGMK